MSLASAMGIPGRNLLPGRSGYGTQVIAGTPKILRIGASVDWNLFAPLGATTELPDKELIFAGYRYARYGQVFARITGAAGSVATVTGGPTGGTFTLSATNSATGTASTQVTAGIAFNATASAVKQALEALNNVGSGNAVVTGGQGGPYAVTFAGILGATTLAASGAGLTGGTAPAVGVAAGAGGNSRFFGPFDAAATDGRQVIARGDCFILNTTKVMGGTFQLPLRDDVHLDDCIIGGPVWGAKVIATNGTRSLAAGPTWAELTAAMPELYPHWV